MKHFYRTLAAVILSLSATTLFGAAWETADNGTTYTLKTLSDITESGVSRVDSNVYLISNDITIMPSDKFVLAGGIELRMAGSTQIRIEGHPSLGDTSARTLITRNSETDTPKGLYIVYDGQEAVSIRNLDFRYAQLRNFGATGFAISDCSFRLGNGKLNAAALSLGKAGAKFTITRCTFAENVGSAIGSGANIDCGITIQDCSIYDCTTANRNTPMINICVGGNEPVIIKNVNITGTGRNMVGGISINNMLSVQGTNVVTIDSVSIRECRYGINGLGKQKLSISRAYLLNNHHETNPMNGGSGISLSNIGDTATISDCHIENSLWGITLIKSPANIGEIGNAASPGNNTFIHNGNRGTDGTADWTPYDLYNNSAFDIFAQNNTWSVSAQTESEIETVIVHKTDNAQLGTVNFMPAKEPMKIHTLASLSQTENSGISLVSEGVYLLSDNVEIPETERFEMEGGVTLRIAGSSQISINGPYRLGQSGARTLITRNSDEDSPKGIYITYNGDTQGAIRNLDFEYASLRAFGDRGFDMDSCSFRLSNGALNSSGALSLGKTGAYFKIAHCTFAENSVPAIGVGANIYCGVIINDCSFYDNNTENSNKPQVNITAGGNNPILLRNLNITGTGRDKVGGIAVSNMMSGTGSNLVTIDSVSIQECRYGITGIGPMALTIANCNLLNNNHESNPMNGGSGISLTSITNNETIIRGCRIENSLWGVTVINSKANLGQVGNLTSPGNNVFVNNGNSASGTYVPYDLYNNSANTIYAQYNYWSVPEQTEAEIEKVIFHKHDNAQLGEVIFMPAGNKGVDIVANDNPNLEIRNGNIITTANEVEIYSIAGIRVSKISAIDGCVALPALPSGIYILRAGNEVLKVRL